MALEKHRRLLGCFRAWLLSLPAAAIASLSSPVLPVAACPVTRTHGTFPEGAPMTARILSICASLLAREEGCRVSAGQKARILRRRGSAGIFFKKTFERFLSNPSCALRPRMNLSHFNPAVGYRHLAVDSRPHLPIQRDFSSSMLIFWILTFLFGTRSTGQGVRLRVTLTSSRDLL